MLPTNGYSFRQDAGKAIDGTTSWGADFQSLGSQPGCVALADGAQKCQVPATPTVRGLKVVA